MCCVLTIVFIIILSFIASYNSDPYSSSGSNKTNSINSNNTCTYPTYHRRRRRLTRKEKKAIRKARKSFAELEATRDALLGLRL